MWLPMVTEVEGTPVGRINEWVGRGQYYFDGPVGPSTVSFVLGPGTNLIDIFAAETSRFCCAAIETSVGIARPDMPKSTAWLAIQTYYSAFYAAHCLLRTAGISASNLYNNECQQADIVATAPGFNNAPLEATQYRCEYLYYQNRLECSKAPGRGIHEQLWRIFGTYLIDAKSRVLNNNSLTNLDAQTIFAKLDELLQILKSNGNNGSNWLSTIRNEVTYRQQHETWFPYGRTKADCNKLFALQGEWLKPPNSIQLKPTKADDLEVFIRTCAFLVSLAVEVTTDMAARNPFNRSFLINGPNRLLRQFRP